MLDIKLIRENPELVKENIKKKFQDSKLPLVDEVLKLDIKVRAVKKEGDDLRAERNSTSKSIGMMMAKKEFEEANKAKSRVVEINQRITELEVEEDKLNKRIREIMLVIPNIIDSSVPIGKDDSENVELEKIGEPFVPDFEVPYHADIIERLKKDKLLKKDISPSILKNFIENGLVDIIREKRSHRIYETRY